MTILIFIIIAIVILIDFTVYSGVKRIFHKSKKTVRNIFWSFTILFVIFSIIYVIIVKNSSKPDYVLYRSYFMLTGIFVLIYLPKLLLAIFFLIEFLLRFISILLNRLFKTGINSILNKIAKTRFLSFTGILISIAMFFIVLEGITIGRTDFKTNHVTVYFKNLPKSFDGLRIAHISDTHLGSFADSLDVKKGIVQLMDEKPDIIMFTGDLVSNQSEEAKIMLPELKRLHAPLGVFSILGNHDVGDYRRWKTIKDKSADLKELENIEIEAGFKLLIDGSYIIRKGSDSLVIIGVNSWGKPPFKKYGSLPKAMKGVENFPFKILLTHNPSHWDMEVAGKNNADLTLAGHTHAMQFGINCFGIFWSPIKWMYPHWAGLYNDGEQYLYVNRGFGFIGFPGRIGMTPEITIIELRRK